MQSNTDWKTSRLLLHTLHPGLVLDLIRLRSYYTCLSQDSSYVYLPSSHLPPVYLVGHEQVYDVEPILEQIPVFSQGSDEQAEIEITLSQNVSAAPNISISSKSSIYTLAGCIF